MHSIMRVAGAVLSLLVTTTAVAAAPLSPDEEHFPAFTGHRGVSIVRTFMFPRKAAGNLNRYVADAYVPHWPEAVPASRLAELLAAGFDFVRVAIDPGPLMEANGAAFDGEKAEIDQAVRQTLKGGLKVLLDIHVNEGDPLWGANAVTEGPSTLANKRYLAVLQALAALAANYDSGFVALEIFNEPPPPCDWQDRPKWQQQLNTIYKEARATAPNTTLFLAGACFASISGLEQLDASAFDANTVFVFHYYSPYLFTFQGFWNGEKYLPYVTRLPYPPDQAQFNAFLLRTAERVSAAKDIPPLDRPLQLAKATSALRSYFLGTHGRRDMDRDFDRVQAWAKRNDVPANRIILGEFGAIRDVWGREGADTQSRARWLSDVRSAAEVHGYRWSVWSLTDTDGIITGDTEGPLDQNVLRAFGLNVSAHN